MFKKMMTLALLAILFLGWHEPISAKTFTPDPFTNPLKPWTITFNDAVSDQADLKSIVIIANGKTNHPVDSTIISTDSTKVKVQPSKRYEPGIVYTLVVPKGFLSANDEQLAADVTMSFELSSTHIESIYAEFNRLATNVVVYGSTNVAKVTVSVGNTSETSLHRLGNKFSRGIPGLTEGELLTIRAYDEHNILLETQTYTVK